MGITIKTGRIHHPPCRDPRISPPLSRVFQASHLYIDMYAISGEINASPHKT